MSNDASFQLNDGLYRFHLPDGTELVIDPIEAIRAGNAIRERCKEKTNFEHLDEFAEWLKLHANVDVPPRVACQIWDAIDLKYSETRKRFTDALKSLSSTESTPSEI